MTKATHCIITKSKKDYEQFLKNYFGDCLPKTADTACTTINFKSDNDEITIQNQKGRVTVTLKSEEHTYCFKIFYYLNDAENGPYASFFDLNIQKVLFLDFEVDSRLKQTLWDRQIKQTTRIAHQPYLGDCEIRYVPSSNIDSWKSVLTEPTPAKTNASSISSSHHPDTVATPMCTIC